MNLDWKLDELKIFKYSYIKVACECKLILKELMIKFRFLGLVLLFPTGLRTEW